MENEEQHKASVTWAHHVSEAFVDELTGLNKLHKAFGSNQRDALVEFCFGYY